MRAPGRNRTCDTRFRNPCYRPTHGVYQHLWLQPAWLQTLHRLWRTSVGATNGATTAVRAGADGEGHPRHRRRGSGTGRLVSPPRSARPVSRCRRRGRDRCDGRSSCPRVRRTRAPAALRGRTTLTGRGPRPDTVRRPAAPPTPTTTAEPATRRVATSGVVPLTTDIRVGPLRQLSAAAGGASAAECREDSAVTATARRV